MRLDFVSRSICGGSQRAPPQVGADRINVDEGVERHTSAQPLTPPWQGAGRQRPEGHLLDTHDRCIPLGSWWRRSARAMYAAKCGSSAPKKSKA